jgi:hypothetical protein
MAICPTVVALRFAREFGSDKALKEYLNKHPGADPAKHSVTEHQEDAAPKKDQGVKKSWKDRFKGLSNKAQEFITKAPQGVKSFLEDDSVRRKVLQDAHKTLTEAPEKIGRRLLDAAKHEVKEFKEAGQGVKALMQGKPMDAHQKKALKTVSIHLAIGVTAAALTASGPLAAAGLFGKGMAQKVALKAVAKVMENVHMFQELGHIGHGAHALMMHMAAEKGGDLTPEDALMAVITAAVAEQIEGLDDKAIQEILESLEAE